MKRWLMVLVLAVALTMPVGYAVAGAYIGTADIKKGAVTAPKLAINSVHGGKIIDGSIKPADLSQKYYTQTEVDALLESYAAKLHGHTWNEVAAANNWWGATPTLETAIVDLRTQNAALLERIEALEASATP